MKAGARKNPKVIFVLLGLYILAQFLWWTYLLISYNPARSAMVIGEGAVFLVLLSIGIYLIYRSVRHEFELNRIQRNFLLAVTHELKTPVAAGKLFMQTLLRHELDAARRKEIIEKALLENNRLSSLIENLLLSASIESREMPFSFVRQDLSSLIADAVGKFSDGLGKDHHFKTQITPDIFFVFDQQAMASVLYNLLDNAVKYSPAGAEIAVKLEKKPGQIVLEVQDSGPGVARGEENRIFDKFYRSGNEDTRSAKGTGLGLFIVKNIVRMHRGEVTCLQAQPRGSIFRINFPTT